MEDYASEFVAHLATLVPHVSEDEQLSLVVETIQRELRDLHASTQAIAAETCEHGGEPPDEYLQDVLTNLLTYRRTQLESMGFVDGLADDFVEALIVEAIESWDEVVISEQSSAEVRAFAQGDMVATFMEGIDPGHRVEVHRFFDETLGRFIEHFGDQIQHSLDGIEYNSLIAKMRELQIELSEYWNQSFDKYVEQNNSAPIMSIVALLPKEELAELAEALVNLTSFKRRVTPAAETVGGPIDVAVISKGDGLVWLKRKHCFPPELNPRYFRRLGFDVSGRVGIVEEES